MPNKMGIEEKAISRTFLAILPPLGLGASLTHVENGGEPIYMLLSAICLMGTVICFKNVYKLYSQIKD